MKKKVFIFVLYSLVAVTVVTAGSRVAQQQFRVSALECTLDDQACPLDVVDKLKALEGQPLLFSDTHQHSQQILNDNFFFEINSIQKKLPSSLIIRLRSDQPVFQLQDQSNYWLIFSEGRARAVSTLQPQLLTFKLENSSPIFNAENTYIKGEVFEWFSVIQQQLSEHSIPFQEVRVLDDQTIEIILNDGLKAVVDRQKTTQQLLKLKLILTQYSEAEVLQQHPVIDLRFELPVLKKGS